MNCIEWIGRRLSTLVALLSVGLTACGGGGGNDASTSTQGATPSNQAQAVDNAYFPLHAGDRWLYQLTSTGGSMHYQIAVGDSSTASGPARTALLTTALDGTLLDDTSYASTSEGVTAFPAASDDYGQAIGPYFVLQQQSLQPGTAFTQVDKTVDGGADVDGDGLNETVVVRSVVEVVDRNGLTVAAARFVETLHLRTTAIETVRYSRTNTQAAYKTVQDDWYAPGVGLIRSDNVQSTNGFILSSTVSELKAYRVNGAHAGAAPQVNSVAPDDGRVHNGSVAVQAIFDTPMDPASLNAGGFAVRDSAGALVNGSVVASPDGLTTVFVPSGGWHSGTYSATISSAAKDRYENPAAPRSWTFTLDTVAPSLVIANPADGTTNVATNATLNYVFSEQIDTSSLMSGGLPLFTLTDDSTGASAPALMSYDSVSAISISPSTYWLHGRSYTLTFPAGTADILGNTLGAPLSVHFSTPLGAFNDPLDVGMLNGRQPQPTLADIDGDGHEDVLWAAWDDTTFPWTMRFYLRRGLGNGTWAPITQPIPTSAYQCAVISVAVGDINADARKDLVIGGMCGLQVLLQQADGTFLTGPRYTPPGMESGQYARLADLNGDGRVDMISSGNATAFQVWLQDVNGQFINTGAFDGEDRAITDLHLADLDGDGRLDMIVQGGPKVFWGLGNGSFSPGALIGTGTLTAFYLGVGDVDRDGHLDVTALMWNPFTGDYQIQVLRQTSARTFAVLSTSTPKPQVPFGFALMDANGDGRLDAVTGYLDAFSIRTGRSDGTFGEEDYYGAGASGNGNWSMAVGPLDAQARGLLVFNAQLYTLRSQTNTTTGIATSSSIRKAPLSSTRDALKPPKPLDRPPMASNRLTN